VSRPRLCAWCSGPFRPGARRDAVTCSKRCRQARARFLRAVGQAEAIATGPGCRLAYADPPYPGRAGYYVDHPDYAGEVDHAALVDQLMTYDGWALSTAADALPAVLELCPPDVQVAAWHRGHRPHKNAAGPLSAWEPVIYRRPRRRAAGPAIADVESAGSRDASTGSQRDTSGSSTRDTSAARDLRDTSTPATRDGYDLGEVSRAAERDTSGQVLRDTSAPGRRDGSAEADVVDDVAGPVTDSLIYPARPRATDPGRVIGAKPAVFARWVFELLGATSADTLDDLFPGSGGIGRAWAAYTGTELAAVAGEELQAGGEPA
jgi:hypothetical protein